MPLVVGTNSWVTLAEAFTHLSSRMGSKDWLDLDPDGSPGLPTRESTLIESFYWLSNDLSYSIPNSCTDDLVKQAQMEGALYLLKYYDETQDHEAAIAQGIKSFSYSKRSETFGEAPRIPTRIVGLLKNYRTDSAGVIQLLGEYDG